MPRERTSPAQLTQDQRDDQRTARHAHRHVPDPGNRKLDQAQQYAERHAQPDRDVGDLCRRLDGIAEVLPQPCHVLARGNHGHAVAEFEYQIGIGEQRRVPATHLHHTHGHTIGKNSGGPLLNRCGEVIGITIAAFLEAENIGFAIPINTVKRVLPQLIHQGRVIRPWFGAIGKMVDQELRDMLNLPLVNGFMVEAVEPGSPAEQAGLQGGDLLMAIAGEEFLFGGDIITMVNGQAASDAAKLLQLLQALKVGETVHLTFSRQGKTQQVKFRLPERPFLPGDLPSEGQRRLQLSHQRPRRFLFSR